jgi:raw score 4.92
MLCSLLCLSACTVDKNIQSNVTSSKEPIEMFMFSQDGGLFVFTNKENFELRGPAISDLSKFLNSSYTKTVEKVEPVFLIDQEDKQVIATLRLYARVDNLTEKQRSELLKTFMFQQTTEVLKNKLQQRYGISAQFDIYDVIYEARGVSRQYENRDELLAKYKLAKPIMATVDRYYGSKVNTSSYSDDDKTINPLTILTAPLWFPVAMLTCLGDKDSSTGFGTFFDPCPFR